MKYFPNFFLLYNPEKKYFLTPHSHGRKEEKEGDEEEGDKEEEEIVAVILTFKNHPSKVG